MTVAVTVEPGRFSATNATNGAGSFIIGLLLEGRRRRRREPLDGSPLPSSVAVASVSGTEAGAASASRPGRRVRRRTTFGSSAGTAASSLATFSLSSGAAAVRRRRFGAGVLSAACFFTARFFAACFFAACFSAPAFASAAAGVASAAAAFFASRTARLLVGPRTGERSTNTQPTPGTGLPPTSLPTSNSHEVEPWNSWNESFDNTTASTRSATCRMKASPRPIAPAGGVSSQPSESSSS